MLVGREPEQSLLHQRLDQALNGRGGLVIVAGEAGIGKTTLVRDLTAQAMGMGCLVLWGHAYDLSVTPPYGPWSEILHDYPTGDSLPPLPAFIGDLEATAAFGSQERLFAAFRDFFNSVSASQPLILILDDLHWADQASLDVLRFLNRQVAAFPILLVAIYRTDEVTYQHPLYALLPILVREGQAVRLEVRPLDEDAHRALLRSRYELSREDETRLGRYLVAHAEGNPLYALELLRTLEEQEVLIKDRGRWHLGTFEEMAMPPFLRQVIAGRLDRLDEDVRHLLQLAAVIGQQVPVDLWQKVSDASDERLVAAIEQGQAAHLIEEVTRTLSYRFRHALFREALYIEVTALRRRQWHRLVADSLETTHLADPTVIAYHLQAAEDPRACEWLIRAGEQAAAAYAWRTAAERMEAALPFLERDPGRQRLRGWVILFLGRLLRFSAPAQGLSYLEQARMLGRQTNDRVLTAVALAACGTMRLYTGDLSGGIVELEAGVSAENQLTPAEWHEAYRLQRSPRGALPVAQDASHLDAADVARVTSEQAGHLVLWMALDTLRVREAATLGEAVLERIERVRDDELLIQHTSTPQGAPWIATYNGLGNAYAILGDPVRAEEMFARAYDLYQRVGHYQAVGMVAYWQMLYVNIPYATEHVAERARLARQAGDNMLKAAGSLPENSPAAFVELMNLMLAGDWETARTMAESASTSLQTSARAMSVIPDYVLGMLARWQGEPGVAWDVVERFLPDGPVIDATNGYGWSRIALVRLAVELALDEGNYDTARAWLQLCHQMLQRSQAVLGRAEAHLLSAQYAQIMGDRVQARQEAEHALALASSPRQPLALITVHRLLGQLETHDHHVGDAEAHLCQSLQIADACQVPYEQALTSVATAELRLIQDRIDETKTLLARARTICEPLRAKPTLARLATLEDSLSTRLKPGYPAGLSSREVEVLRLVALGMTDADVADRLYISRRTVSQHLRSIYNKLGVSARLAATRFAIDHNLA